MHILLLNQFFWPDEAATSQLLTDVARALAAAGCQVTAICGRSRYAGGNGAAPPAVKILRTPESPFSRTKTGRLISYASFLIGVAWHGARAAKPDVILSLTTPPGLAVMGALLARVRGARHYIWEMDVYPDVAEALGALRAGGWVAKALGKVFDAARARADGVIALGECMAARIEARGVPRQKISVAENWADGGAIRPRPFPADGKLTLLYSGHLGLAHDVETIRGAVLRLRADERFRFVFAGGGPLRADLEEFGRANGLRLLAFRPYCAREELGNALAEGDIGLVTQKPETLGCVVPSKTYGIMAAARPVLFIGPREATPARIIRRFDCGWQVDCGDTENLVALLRQLAEHPELIHSAGRRAREAFLARYDLPVGAGRICRILGAGSVLGEMAQAAAVRAV